MKLCIHVALLILISATALISRPAKAQVRTYEGSTPDKCTERMVDTTHFPDNRDQMNLQWCHSYALADLLSFYSQKKISAYAIAARSYQYWKTQDDKNLANDNTNLTEWNSSPYHNFSALAYTNNKLCLESNFKPEDNNWSQLSELLAKTEESPNTFCSKSRIELATGIDETTFKAIDKLGKRSFILATINLKCKEQQELPSGALTLNTTDGFSHCAHSKKQALSCSDTIYKNNVDLPIDKLDDKLSNSEPALVYYAAKFLKENERLSYRNYNHFSAVIGRRFNKELNECEYLIRNSWGTDCSYYQKKYADKCTDGNIWIPRIDLLKNMGGFYTFDSDKN